MWINDGEGVMRANVIAACLLLVVGGCYPSNGLPAGRWYEYAGVSGRSIDGGQTFYDLSIKFEELPKGTQAKIKSTDGHFEVEAEDLKEGDLKTRGFNGPTLTSGENVYEYINNGCMFKFRKHVPISMAVNKQSGYVCVATVRGKEHVLRPGITPAQVEAIVGKLKRKR